MSKAASTPPWNSFRGCVRPSRPGTGRNASPAPATCPTSTGHPPGPGGRWPATPATTKTPRTGMGMSDAFLAAELLADAIHQGLVRAPSRWTRHSPPTSSDETPDRQRVRTHLEHRPARPALAQARGVVPDRRRPARSRPPRLRGPRRLHPPDRPPHTGAPLTSTRRAAGGSPGHLGPPEAAIPDGNGVPAIHALRVQPG